MAEEKDVKKTEDLDEAAEQAADGASGEKDEKNKKSNLETAAEQTAAVMKETDEFSDEELSDMMDELEDENASGDYGYGSGDRIFTAEELAERESEIGTKSVQAGNYTIENEDGERLDKINGLSAEEQKEKLGGEITKGKDGKNHYSGTLGEFDYDPKEFAIGYKTIYNKDKSASTDVPVLRYIGDKTAGNDVDIPEGVKNLDYTFEGNKKLETVPKIPDSVESAHCAFMDCTGVWRASKDAKEGEQDGVVKGLAAFGAGASAGAVTGAAVTSWSGPGAFIGGGIGALVGGIGGVIWGTNTDGKGGTWSMPENLKDATYMFAGCDKLTEGFEKASEDLIATRGMYADTDDMGTDEYALKHGSDAVTDLTDSNVSQEAAEGMYTGSNEEVKDDLKETPNYSMYWDEDTGTLNNPDADPELKEEVEELSETLAAEDAANGVVETDMSIATHGLASNMTVETEHGQHKTTDPTEENVEKSGGLGDFGSLIDRGLVSFGEYKILKLVTGSTLLSAGITFAGQMIGILPKSMSPILDGIAGMVGEDSAIGKALGKVSDMLGGGEDEKKSKTEEVVTEGKDEGDETHSDLGERLESSMDSVKVSMGSGKEIETAMYNNAKSVAKDGVFLTVANQNEASSKDLAELKNLSNLEAAGLEEKCIELGGEDKKLSNEGKQTVADSFMNTMRGLAAYNNGALDAIEEKYGKDTEQSRQAQLGLEKTMRVASAPFMDAMKELNADYDFLSKENIAELEKMNLSGVTNYKDYEIGMDMAPAALTSTNELYDEDEAMYGEAGLNDDVDTSEKNAEKTDEKSESKDGKTEFSEKKPEQKSVSTKETDKSMSQADQIAQANAMFGHITGQTEETQMSY